MEVFTFQISAQDTTVENLPELFNTSTRIEEQDREIFFTQSIPVTIFLGILCLLGTVGNILALAVFRNYSASPLRILLLYMVSADLLTCIVCIPLEVVQIRFTLTYPSVALCRFTRYCTHYSSLTAGVSLILVALERRQKLCAPLERQLSLKTTKKLIVIIALICSVVSLPAIFFYKVSDVTVLMNDLTLTGKGCTESRMHDIAEVYAGIIIVVCLIGFIICAVAYTQIVRVIRRQIRAEKHRAMKFSEAMMTADDISSPVPTNRKESDVQDMWDQFSSTLRKRKKREKRFKESRTTSVMLLLATGVSFAGFLLHVAAVIIINVVGIQRIDILGSVNSILLRGYFLHFATHPIVYLSFDRQFRIECKKIYRSLRKDQ